MIDTLATHNETHLAGEVLLQVDLSKFASNSTKEREGGGGERGLWYAIEFVLNRAFKELEEKAGKKGNGTLVGGRVYGFKVMYNQGISLHREQFV